MPATLGSGHIQSTLEAQGPIREVISTGHKPGTVMTDTTIAAAPAAARKPPRLIFAAAALAVIVLIAAFVVIGYPLAIIVGLAGTGAFLTSLVVLTAADLFGRGK